MNKYPLTKDDNVLIVMLPIAMVWSVRKGICLSQGFPRVVLDGEVELS